MYVVRDLDGNDVTIKRLSKHEKELLIQLDTYKRLGSSYFEPLSDKKKYNSFIDREEELKYISGERVPVWILRRDLNVHRASLSRMLSTLEKKRLIFSYGRSMLSESKYTKYVRLTHEGKQIIHLLARACARD